MDLFFATRDLQRICNQQKAMVDRWGPAGAEVVGQRLQELDAADRLGDVRLLPHLRVEADDESEEVIVEGRDGVRVWLAPQESNPNPRSGVPWHEAKAVVVLDVRLEGR